VFFAVPLGIIGVGLLIGAWIGRARWLIAPGLLLAFALAAGTGAEHVNWADMRHGGPNGDVTWAPATVSDIHSRYQLDAGNGTLDLSQVDFTDRSVDVEVSVNVGDVVVILPPKVDVDVDAKVSFGDGNVFNEQWNGIDKSRRHISDNGVDGSGGGHLHLVANVDVGTLEVHR
jgi:hypothetical protein